MKKSFSSEIHSQVAEEKTKTFLFGYLFLNSSKIKFFISESSKSAFDNQIISSFSAKTGEKYSNSFLIFL
jgi:hypothetical protein